MPSTCRPQSAPLMMNWSKPAETVPLMRTIFPLNDDGFLRMSQTVASTACACRQAEKAQRRPSVRRCFIGVFPLRRRPISPAFLRDRGLFLELERLPQKGVRPLCAAAQRAFTDLVASGL